MVGNIVFQLFIGAGIESGIGFWRILFLYFTSGFGGILLSMCARPNAKGIGASSAIFGLIGFYLSYVFTNWHCMGHKDPNQRLFLILFCIWFIILNIDFSDQITKSDNFGHLGGGTTGFLAGLSISEQYDVDARNEGRIPDRLPSK